MSKIVYIWFKSLIRGTQIWPIVEFFNPNMQRDPKRPKKVWNIPKENKTETEVITDRQSMRSHGPKNMVQHLCKVCSKTLTMVLE